MLHHGEELVTVAKGGEGRQADHGVETWFSDQRFDVLTDHRDDALAPDDRQLGDAIERAEEGRDLRVADARWGGKR